MITYKHRCSRCVEPFDSEQWQTAFCPQCLRDMASAVADIEARSARVQRGELSVIHEGCTKAEQDAILETRRRGNFTRA